MIVNCSAYLELHRVCNCGIEITGQDKKYWAVAGIYVRRFVVIIIYLSVLFITVIYSEHMLSIQKHVKECDVIVDSPLTPYGNIC